MLVGMKTTADADVELIASRALRLADRACGAVTTRLNFQYLLYPSSFLCEGEGLRTSVMLTARWP